jgi:putative NADPH-quinone reductase
MSRVTIIQGHPDPAGGHFCHALAETYGRGACAAGHEVRSVDVALLEFPLLRSQAEYRSGALPAGLASAQADLLWAEHYLIVYPLWAGTMPALLKGFLEQVLRPEVVEAGSAKPWAGALRGRSARVVVTMGMPAFVYRWVLGAHGLKNLERNILRFVGVRPVRATLIGMIESLDAARRGRWLGKVEELGRRLR